VTTPPSLGDTSLYIDYIYLDTDERRQFAQVQHEYLIEQVQFTGDESFSNSSVKSRLALNHPVKELVWVIQPDTNATANRWADYTDGTTAYAGADTLGTAKLQLNGHDRFSVRGARYFNVVQPYQHHTRTPATGIYSYSFCINPEAHQPSGSVNMSRIDNAVLQLTLTTGTAAVKLRVYAVNYNVLRIMAGMGGLAFVLLELKSIMRNHYLILVNLFLLLEYKFATLPNCGEILRAKNTKVLWKHSTGQERTWVW
jgi:Large eukaryotic DNA virus major capsid protein